MNSVCSTLQCRHLAGGKRGDGGNGDEGRVGREMEGEVGEDEG